MSRKMIAELKGWKLFYQPNWYEYGPTLWVEPPEDSPCQDTRITARRIFHKNYTLAEMLMQAVDHIQRQELWAAQQRNEIAMAQDLAKALIEDNLLGAGS